MESRLNKALPSTVKLYLTVVVLHQVKHSSAALLTSCVQAVLISYVAKENFKVQNLKEL